MIDLFNCSVNFSFVMVTHLQNIATVLRCAIIKATSTGGFVHAELSPCTVFHISEVRQLSRISIFHLNYTAGSAVDMSVTDRRS